MSTKKSSTKKVTVKREPRKVDEKTGFKEGSLGHQVGRAYLTGTKYEKALEAVEAVLKEVAKEKGKPTTQEYVHGRAISWIAFLKVKDSKTFQDFPKEKKAKAKEAVKA